MKKLIILLLALISFLVLAGCILNPESLGKAAKKPETSKPQCKTGQTQTCITAENCSGTQFCEGKLWGACIDIENDGCPVIPCDENWSCSSWSSCFNGNQTRTCTDLNECGAQDYNESQSCGECINGTTQNCITAENCTGIQSCVSNYWSLCQDVPNDSCPVIDTNSDANGF